MKEKIIITKNIDIPLFIPNMLKFGIMKNINTYTLKDIREKLTEEYKEVLAETDNDLNKLVPELFDVAQVVFTYLKKLELEGKIIIEEENFKHLEKLNKRGYIK